jgi:hypothetical protein
LIRTWLLVIDIFSVWIAAQHRPDQWGAAKGLMPDSYAKKLLIRLAECYVPHFFEPPQFNEMREYNIRNSSNYSRATRAEL